MSKIGIIYASVHHENTKKLLQGIAKGFPVDLLTPAQAETADLSQYGAVGFASGIYFSKFHESILSLVEKPLPFPKKAFLLYTSGSGGANYAKPLEEKLKSLGLSVLGVYRCKGYDTYGPWKLVGGIAKGHPSQADVEAGTVFLQNKILSKIN